MSIDFYLRAKRPVELYPARLVMEVSASRRRFCGHGYYSDLQTADGTNVTEGDNEYFGVPEPDTTKQLARVLEEGEYELVDEYGKRYVLDGRGSLHLVVVDDLPE